LTPPAAVVFDLDGLLVESESRWTIAEQRVVAELGGTWDLELKRRMLGTSLSQAAETMAEWVGVPPERAPEIALAVLDGVLDAVEEHGADAMPGARALVADLAGKVPLAVASNSTRQLVGAVLRASGLPDVWDAVVCAGDGLRPKPEPDVYLAACRELAVAPERSLALEDSPTGVAAARAAGMRVIGIPSLPGLDLHADAAYPSLEAVDLAALGLA
jgi:HAD superfamily hydrolase (TIGR01509 family)